MPRIKPKRSADPGSAAALGTRPIVGTIVFGILIALASGGGLWTIHKSSRDALDQEMGERLVLIADEVAAIAQTQSLLQWAVEDPIELQITTFPFQATLEAIAARRGLNYIVLYSFEGNVLVDTSLLREPGEADPYLLGLDRELAFALQTSHSPTRPTVGGFFLKSAYAPIFDPFAIDEAPLGYVAVHAAPDFFGTLRTLRRTLLGVGVAVFSLLGIAIGVFLFYARRLARARAALARSEQLSAMGRMAAGIAHEIRNPLGIIKNTAQLLKEELDDAGVDSELVRYIPEEVDRLNETLTGYLDFAKDAPLRFESVELGKLVQRTLKLVQRDLAAAHVQLVDALDRVGDARVIADPRRLQQVLLNLLLNAIQAMPEGGELRVTLSEESDMVGLSVEDTGIGMEPAHAEQIFEPFVTSKEKGSGLGLHVVRRIVEDHGGRIELETEFGKGTTFTVWLPADSTAAVGED